MTYANNESEAMEAGYYAIFNHYPYALNEEKVTNTRPTYKRNGMPLLRSTLKHAMTFVFKHVTHTLQ